jgi:hypothetical protein
MDTVIGEKNTYLSETAMTRKKYLGSLVFTDVRHTDDKKASSSVKIVKPPRSLAFAFIDISRFTSGSGLALEAFFRFVKPGKSNGQRSGQGSYQNNGGYFFVHFCGHCVTSAIWLLFL